VPLQKFPPTLVMRWGDWFGKLSTLLTAVILLLPFLAQHSRQPSRSLGAIRGKKTLFLIMNLGFLGALSSTLSACGTSNPTARVAPFDPFSAAAISSSTLNELSSEATLEARIATLESQYEAAEKGTLLGQDGKLLSYRVFSAPSPKAAILLLPGRTEPIRKYTEVIDDLVRNSFHVYALSHRGQGESERLASSSCGHLDAHTYLTRDLKAFVDQVVVPREGSRKLFILAHSMGGAVAAQYLRENSSRVSAAVLNAPMMEINTSPFSESVASSLANSFCGYGTKASCSIGQKAFDENAVFDDKNNTVTQSQTRFNYKMKQFREHPELQIGGVTHGWLCESFALTGILRGRISPTTHQTPTLILQAGEEKVVINAAQNRYCELAPSCAIKTFPGAYHEILMEKDEYRKPAIEGVIRFFNHYTGNT
jgi:lysophospholipase